MAKLIAVCRDKVFPFERRQIPLMIEETLTMVMEIPETVISTECVSEHEVKQFKERYNLLSLKELTCALMVSQKDLFSLLSLSVPCVGCRRSVERLFKQLLESGQPAVEPLVIKASGVLTLSDSFLFDPNLVYALFYIHGSHLNDMVDTMPKSRRNRRCILHSLETHKTRSLGWMDVWDLLSQECRDEVVLIDADLLLETLENYLRKHRFCSECKSKVLRAYNILTGDIEGDGEKGYCANLYEGLKSCPKERHIHVLCDTDFIAHLIDRAEPELTGGRRERHARTIEIAQEEVLTCLGIHLWERLHRLWQKLRAEEQTWQMLFYLGVEALRKNFEVAIEDKQGISRLEQVVEEISEAERAKELKKEQKRMKKKKRKENKCKFANELAEKKGTITNGHNVESLGKENGFENENDRESCKSESKEEKPVHCSVETKVNGSLTCKENGSKENNIVESTTTESVINDSKNSRKSIENDCDSITDSLLYDSCDCGDDVKENPHRKNGFINASEEKPFTLYSKAKGPTNGYVTPPACRSCGQQLSPRDKYDRGPPSDRGKGAAVYSEICAKCAAMNSEGGKRRNRKKVSKSKEFHENFNPRPKTDSKSTTRHHPIKDIDTKTNEFNDAELKLLESMGWHRLDDDATSDSGQSSLLEDAVISEQEIKEFQARKKDMQSQREQLRERLRHQFQMMCIHHSANCPCIDRPANGIKLK